MKNTPQQQKPPVSFTDILRAIGQNEVVCLCTLLAAIMYDMFYLDLVPPAFDSLSNIGRRRYVLFFFWCVFSGTALLLNIPRMYFRCGYNGKAGMRLLYGSEFCLLLTMSNMSAEKNHHRVHIVTAITFGILAWFSILVGLYHMRHNRRFRILSCVYSVFCLIDVRFLLVYRQMALYEFIPLLLSFCLMFVINFTKEFDIPEDRRFSPSLSNAIHEAEAKASPTSKTTTSSSTIRTLPPGHETLLAFRERKNAEASELYLNYHLTPLQDTISQYAGAVFLGGAFYAFMRFRLGPVAF